MNEGPDDVAVPALIPLESVNEQVNSWPAKVGKGPQFTDDTPELGYIFVATTPAGS